MKAVFICYSPGVSPLVFCWQDHDTEQRYVISNKPVRPYMIRDYLNGPRGKHFKEQGYQIHKIESRWTILKSVERVDERTLRMDGDLFRYRITSPVAADQELWPNSIRFEFQRPDITGAWWNLRNLSMLTNLTHFLRYEPILEQTRYKPGKAIKDSDTWTPKRAWEVTEFPDGDGYTFDC